MSFVVAYALAGAGTLLVVLWVIFSRSLHHRLCGSRSGGLFTLREGTLYPILYRLEDDGLIEAVWQQETGRAAPRKIYSATEKGREENERRLGLWAGFRTAVDHFCGEDAGHE